MLCVQYPDDDDDDDDDGNNNDAFISFKHSASTHRQLWLKFFKNVQFVYDVIEVC